IVHFPLARKMPTIATDRPSEKLHLLGESKMLYILILAFDMIIFHLSDALIISIFIIDWYLLVN
ncbi:hypothetical protein, partial [Xenorhabdus bovienii]|uniref:hypothetical protein n=1 Tax=Xenorhabdus bovienii TaxID=40576 RepID=UPI00237CA795